MTQQAANIIFYDHHEYRVYDFSPFHEFRLITPEMVGLQPKYDRISTACWRGYTYTAEVIDDHLFLTHLTIYGSCSQTLQDVSPNAVGFYRRVIIDPESRTFRLDDTPRLVEGLIAYENIKIPILSTGSIKGIEIMRDETGRYHAVHNKALIMTFNEGLLIETTSATDDSE